MAGAYSYLWENKSMFASLKAQEGMLPEVLVPLLLMETKLDLNVSTALAGDLWTIELYLSRTDLPPEICTRQK